MLSDDENDSKDKVPDLEDENNEDNWYKKFFAESKIQNYDYSGRTFYQDLLNEERKWLTRIEWLEQQMEKLRQSP